jgi:hypothetical protein
MKALADLKRCKKQEWHTINTCLPAYYINLKIILKAGFASVRWPSIKKNFCGTASVARQAEMADDKFEEKEEPNCAEWRQLLGHFGPQRKTWLLPPYGLDNQLHRFLGIFRSKPCFVFTCTFILHQFFCRLKTCTT